MINNHTSKRELLKKFEIIVGPKLTCAVIHTSIYLFIRI
jgi:hypothetical protein